tara:strand:+ start:1065 stop:1433 length:369 start_codon:yes stop_codon:yes gene_type:complete
MIDPASKTQYIQRVTNAKISLTTTNATTLYTAPAGTDFDFAVIESILVNNNNASATTLNLTLTNSAAAVFNLYDDFTIAGNATSELLSRDLVLQAGEILKVTVNNANRIMVVASLTEYAKGD